jgi:D-psicose/D-tagatose/L-ribulose 3-epimerase
MAFRLSAHNWMRDEELDITLERLSNCGFWGIEIMGSPERPEYQDRAAMRAKLKKYKLECWGAVTLMLQKRDLIHGDAKERKNSIAYVNSCIDLISDLGGQVLTLVPSEVGKIVAMASPKEESGLLKA